MKEKIAFETYEQAREELERIVNTNYNCCKKENRKPNRIYYENNKFYLTSKINICCTQLKTTKN